MALRDIVVVKEQAVTFDTTIPLAVRIVWSGGESAFRGAVHLERLAYIVYHQFLVSLLGNWQGLVGVYRVELMVRPRGGMVIAISLIRTQPCVTEILIFVSTPDKDSHTSDYHRNQKYTCFHFLFIIVVIGCKNTNNIRYDEKNVQVVIENSFLSFAGCVRNRPCDDIPEC